MVKQEILLWQRVRIGLQDEDAVGAEEAKEASDTGDQPAVSDT